LALNFFSGVGSVKLFISARVTSSKVIDFGTNQKRIRDFLLVRRSNFGFILQRFKDTAGFVLMTPPLFHPNFGGVSVGPDRLYVGVSQSRNLELISREIIFEVFLPV